MLSFGCSLLQNHVATALQASGLSPRLGLMHREKRAYYALACDLQEEFRFLVDAHVWAMIRSRQAKPGDFKPSPDGRYPCLMDRGLRKKFILGLERRLLTKYKTIADSEALSYREIMFRQAQAIKAMFQGKADFYEALRLRA